LPFAQSDVMPDQILASTTAIPITLVNQRPLDDTPFIAPYVPVSPDVADRAIAFARLRATDTLVDLGCGDARILRQALLGPTPPQQAVGVELDPYLAEHNRVEPALRTALATGRCVFYEQDMFTVDLVALKATVLILYLLPAGLAKLRPQLARWLATPSASPTEPAKRVISIIYAVPDWTP
ncbi:hypothetical protein CXG81DRAFT_779, partial [Caulochytrium protostelioides]